MINDERTFKSLENKKRQLMGTVPIQNIETKC